MTDKRLIIINDDDLPPTFSFADNDKISTLMTVSNLDFTDEIRHKIKVFNGKNRKRKVLHFGRLFMKKLAEGAYSTDLNDIKTVLAFETQEYKNMGETIDKHSEMIDEITSLMTGVKYITVKEAEVLVKASEDHVSITGNIQFVPSSMFQALRKAHK